MPDPTVSLSIFNRADSRFSPNVKRLLPGLR